MFIFFLRSLPPLVPLACVYEGHAVFFPMSGMALAAAVLKAWSSIGVADECCGYTQTISNSLLASVKAP